MMATRLFFIPILLLLMLLTACDKEEEDAVVNATITFEGITNNRMTAKSSSTVTIPVTITRGQAEPFAMSVFQRIGSADDAPDEVGTPINLSNDLTQTVLVEYPVASFAPGVEIILTFEVFQKLTTSVSQDMVIYVSE